MTSQSRSGDVIARELAALAIGTFGSVRATPEQIDELANHLTLTAVTWINDEFKIGLPDG